MRIAKVEPLLIDRFLFVEITTDDDVVGLGEAGCWAFHEATVGALTTSTEYLIGKDPRRIEHHFQMMYRWAHFCGPAIMAALSAVDIALWDSLGKHHGAPVHALLGGKVRDKARAYYHVFGRTKDELFAGVATARAGLHRGGALDAVPRFSAKNRITSRMRGRSVTPGDGSSLPRDRRTGHGPLHRNPPPLQPLRGDSVRPRHRAVLPVVPGRSRDAGQLRRDGSGSGQGRHSDRHQ